MQVDKESEATQIINRRKTLHQKREEQLKLRSKRLADGTDIVVPLIVKGDVWGSVEALIGILKSKQPELMKLSVIHAEVGVVSDSDVEMASSVGGMLYCIHGNCIHGNRVYEYYYPQD